MRYVVSFNSRFLASSACLSKATSFYFRLVDSMSSFPQGERPSFSITLDVFNDQYDEYGTLLHSDSRTLYVFCSNPCILPDDAKDS